MAKENETVADIIAEKRRRAEEIERDCSEKMKRGEMTSDQYARELVADIRREADRLDAAHKRERGDCAKLREALINVVKRLEAYVGCDHHTFHPAATTCDGITSVGKCGKIGTCAAIFKARAALAAPARNCDAIPAEEMRKIFREELPVQLKIATEHEKKIIQLTADGIFDTVFAPYQPPKESEAGK